MRLFPLLSTPSKCFFVGVFQLATDALRRGDCGGARSIALIEGSSTLAENIFPTGAGVTASVAVTVGTATVTATEAV